MVEEKELIGKCLKYNLEIVERNAWKDMFFSASEETKRKLSINFLEVGSAGALMVPAVDTLALNRVLGFGLDDNTDDQVLEKIISEFYDKKIPRFFFQISPEKLDDSLKTKLKKYDLSHYNNWTKLYRSADKPLNEYDSEIIVEQTGAAGANNFSEILINSFGWNPVLADLIYDFISRESHFAKNKNWIFYIGYYRHKAVSVASLYIEEEYCWLGLAATLKEYRGLGAQHALIYQRIKDGLNNGCKHFVVETAEHTSEKRSQSFLNLIDMGFELIYKRPNFIRYNFE